MSSTNSNLDAIEREVRRRVSDYMASAGVPYGRIAVEILYMLPPDFVRAYRKVWDRALRPDVVSSGGAGGGGGIEKAKNSKNERSRQSWANGARHGKGYANHWVVKDEEAMKLKGSADRKLGRLASELEEMLGKPKARAGELQVQCASCDTTLAELQRGVRWKLRFCPRCGSGLGE